MIADKQMARNSGKKPPKPKQPPAPKTPPAKPDKSRKPRGNK